jgi:hypothetical protein
MVLMHMSSTFVIFVGVLGPFSGGRPDLIVDPRASD